MLFPLLIAALVTLRLFGLPKYFTEKEIDQLDYLDVEATRQRMTMSPSSTELADRRA